MTCITSAHAARSDKLRRMQNAWRTPMTVLVCGSRSSRPLLLNDETHVLRSEPGRRLVLQAKGWPFGEATVDLTLEPRGAGCRIVMREDISKGPGRVVPKPVRQLLLQRLKCTLIRFIALILCALLQRLKCSTG